MKGSARFWRRVDKSGECWVWTGASAGRKPFPPMPYMSAYRFAYLDTGHQVRQNESIEPGCGNNYCVRPEHMNVGGRTWPHRYRGSANYYQDAIADALAAMLKEQ